MATELPWYLQESDGWKARPYFAEDAKNKVDYDVVSQSITEVKIEQTTLASFKTPHYLSKNPCFQNQIGTRFHNSQSVSLSYHEDINENWCFSLHNGNNVINGEFEKKKEKPVVEVMQKNRIMDRETFQRIGKPFPQSQKNVDELLFQNYPFQHYSRQALRNDVKRKQNNHNQLTDRARFAKEKESQSNQLIGGNIRNRSVIDLFSKKQGISPSIRNRSSDNLFEESPNFEHFNGTINDLLELSIPCKNKLQNEEITLHFIMYIWSSCLCIFIVFKMLQWLQGLRIQLIKAQQVHGKVNSSKVIKDMQKKRIKITETGVKRQAPIETKMSGIVKDDAVPVPSPPSDYLCSQSETEAFSNSSSYRRECETDILNSKSSTIVTTRCHELVPHGIVDNNFTTVPISMTGVAQSIKAITSRFSQEGLDEHMALQLAQVTLDMQYKEMSEIRRIQLEDRRRKEDMIVEERRHHEKIKAVSHQLHFLYDEAQKARSDFNTNMLGICLGTHQILCILVGCATCLFKRNWAVMKHLTSKKTSFFDFIISLVCFISFL